MGVVIGVDIGQRVDPTAIAVVESEDRAPAGPAEHRRAAAAGVFASGAVRVQANAAHFVVRHLERLPLGTSYPDVARRVAVVCAGVRQRTRETPTLYVDATGVGTPVLDALHAAGLEADLWGVYFTHGDRRSEERSEREVKLGKAWLVSRLQVLLSAGRLHLPQTAEAEQLARELLDYEIRVDENANDRYGAFKVGTHDDLVTALGLAVQRDPVQWLIW
jgi:hypothetical protein